MAGSKSTAGASGRVQKKTPSKTSKPSSNSSSKSAGSTKSLYSGTAEGVTQLPVARVKRIIKEDKDVQMVSNDAVFLISLATELFLESFTTKAFNLAKIEKRKTVSYKDLATAVTQHDSLEFLQDVIPKTMTLTAAIEKQRAAQEKEEMGDDNDGAEDEEANGDGGDGSEAGSGDEGDEESRSSRPMSEDEGELSTPEDMDED
ncbi:MAG: histone-fold-containing protein [Linnemannia gamsii]|nr:MAG: histone-fold-containing protein [Linnemannia gamsii]